MDKLKNIKERTFAEHIANDKMQHANYLKREKLLGSKDAEDLNAIKTYKRVFNILSKGDLKITPQKGETISAKDNALPIESYLGHGARVMLQLPKGSEDKIFNYITSGDMSAKKVSSGYGKTQEDMNKGNFVYNRTAATHSISFKKTESGEMKAHEEKGLSIGIQSYFYSVFTKVASYFYSVDNNTGHYGLDIAINKTDLGVDLDHGHLYMYYSEETDTTPPAILLGIESSAPDSPNHSKVGASDPYSATDGLLWEDLAKVKDLPKNVVIPKKYNGMYMNISDEELEDIEYESAGPKVNLLEPKTEKSEGFSGKNYSTDSDSDVEILDKCSTNDNSDVEILDDGDGFEILDCPSNYYTNNDDNSGVEILDDGDCLDDDVKILDWSSTHYTNNDDDNGVEMIDINSGFIDIPLQSHDNTSQDHNNTSIIGQICNNVSKYI